MNYFINCQTIDEAKKLYKKLAKEHHPDLGGETIVMQKINLEFEKISKDFFKNNVKNETDFDFTEFNQIIEKIIYMENVKIEIIGRWIYVFNCYQQKEELKNLGFWFSVKHKAWIYNKESKNKYKRTKLTTNQVKNKFGVVEVESKRTEKLI